VHKAGAAGFDAIEQDGHTDNIAFLLDRNGREIGWRGGPAAEAPGDYGSSR
jgi:hypothetical protein